MSLPLPDLLHHDPRPLADRDQLFAFLDLAFLGKDTGGGIDRALDRREERAEGFDPRLFAADLFIDDLLRAAFPVVVDGDRFSINLAFLRRVLSRPPLDLETVNFRQEILRELIEDDALRTATERLYKDLSQLLTMFKVPDHVARLDINAHRLELFRQLQLVIDRMASDFGTARSGLRRIHEAGLAIQGRREYRVLRSLLDYEDRFVSLNLDLSLAPDGNVRRLEISKIAENKDNPFYRSPWKRLLTRLRLFAWHGVMLSNREMVNRLLHQVFLDVGTPLLTIVELMGHLEFHLASLGFRRLAREHGLETSFATLAEGRPLRLERAFNPLLLAQTTPVPADVERLAPTGATLLTGPNSGGKTRLLQTIGLAQLLGQSGTFVPAARAELPLLRGLFVSVIESEAADHAEGRLGREMLRIRSLFEGVDAPALVILDELCSGTNPSEGTELFSLVLELLERLGAVAFISTHFLDYAQGLADAPAASGLEFLQVEIDEHQRSTYQFRCGVASTSLAAITAERLGVTFESLAELIDGRRA